MNRVMKIAAFLVTFSVGAIGITQGRMPAGTKTVTVNIKRVDGKTVGTAVLSEVDHGVKIMLDIKSLPPGPHFIHIHQHPLCQAPDFQSAGPHFDPMGGMNHGDHGAAGMPAGDIPNFVLNVNADGTARTSVVAPNLTLGADTNSVLSNGGTSIVIHAVADKVTAAAPPRIACGVIERL